MNREAESRLKAKCCPFKNGPPEICRQFEVFFNGTLEAINPELEYRYDRMMKAIRLQMGDKEKIKKRIVEISGRYHHLTGVQIPPGPSSIFHKKNDLCQENGNFQTLVKL